MRTKPKIIISSYDNMKNPYYAGGGARAIHSIAKRLTNKYEIVVITSKYGGTEDEIIDSVYYKRIGVSWGGPKLGQLLFQMFLPIAVLREEFDVWVESFTPPFSTTFLPLFTSKPVIGLVHMLAASDMVRKYKLPFNVVEQLGLKFYKQFIVLNEETKRKILKSNPRAKIFIVGNGVDMTDRLKSLKSERNTILYMGRIEVNQKGLDLLLYAYDLISKRVDQKLVIAGNGYKDELQKLDNLINSLKLSDRVKVIGRVDGDSWERTLNNASVVVIPSRYETFPLVALEALAHNAPVVGFDIDGLKWLPQSVSLKAKKFDYYQYAQYILKLTSDSKERRNIMKSIDTFIKSYTWESVTLRYDQVFRDVLIN